MYLTLVRKIKSIRNYLNLCPYCGKKIKLRFRDKLKLHSHNRQSRNYVNLCAYCGKKIKLV